mmetsp:Transcript_2653/g.9549  ORF Transcript_2653/g.9549 Transcript_2653/m.9549 type:complete len:224 (+) Transcript_2653:3862-4533(+)
MPLVSLASILFGAMPALNVYPSSSTQRLRRPSQMYAPAASNFSSSRHSCSSRSHHATDASSGSRGRNLAMGSGAAAGSDGSDTVATDASWASPPPPTPPSVAGAMTTPSADPARKFALLTNAGASLAPATCDRLARATTSSNPTSSSAAFALSVKSKYASSIDARSITPPHANTCATLAPASRYDVKSALDRRVGTCTNTHSGANLAASPARICRFTLQARAS